MKKALVSLLVVFSFFVANLVAQNGKPAADQPHAKWIEIENEWDGRYSSIRTVYLLLDEEGFSPEIVRTLAKKLSIEFPLPKTLSIRMFSEKDRLDEYKQYRNPGFSIAFPDTPDGRRAHELYDDSRRPKPIGYYAWYFRNNSGAESLFMTQKSGDDHLVPVDLGGKVKE